MTQETKEPTFKRLKITGTKGEINYVPFNQQNVKFYTEHKAKLTPEKREKFKIEEVELSLEEAAEMGIYEAYEILHPPKKKGQSNELSVVDLLMKQNQTLMERLAVLEKGNEPKKVK
jgi:hypothetical protein